MKKAVVILSAALCGIVLADEVVATTLLADGSTNTWTQTDLRDALGLMNRMYHRDMDTDAGRRKWHGERIGHNGSGGLVYECSDIAKAKGREHVRQRVKLQPGKRYRLTASVKAMNRRVCSLA